MDVAQQLGVRERSPASDDCRTIEVSLGRPENREIWQTTEVATSSIVSPL